MLYKVHCSIFRRISVIPSAFARRATNLWHGWDDAAIDIKRRWSSFSCNNNEKLGESSLFSERPFCLCLSARPDSIINISLQPSAFTLNPICKATYNTMEISVQAHLSEWKTKKTKIHQQKSRKKIMLRCAATVTAIGDQKRSYGPDAARISSCSSVLDARISIRISKSAFFLLVFCLWQLE